MNYEQVVQNIKDNKGSPNVYNNENIVKDIVRLIDRWKTQQKRPCYLYCIVTGVKCPMTAKALWVKRLAKCKNDVGCLFTTYASRNARKAGTVKVLTGKSGSDGSVKHKTFEPFWRNAFRPGAHTVYPITKEQKVRYAASLVTDTCQRPDLNLSTWKCNSCPYALLCQAPCRLFAISNNKSSTFIPDNVLSKLIGNASVWQPMPGMLQYDMICHALPA